MSCVYSMFVVLDYAYVTFSWGNRQRKYFYLVVLFECSLLFMLM